MQAGLASWFLISYLYSVHVSRTEHRKRATTVDTVAFCFDRQFRTEGEGGGGGVPQLTDNHPNFVSLIPTIVTFFNIVRTEPTGVLYFPEAQRPFFLKINVSCEIPGAV